MNSELILLIILFVIAVNYLLDLFSGLLNYRSFVMTKFLVTLEIYIIKRSNEKSQKYKKRKL